MLNNREDGCYYCGNPHVELHHIMFGVGNRKIADKYKVTVWLCKEHHTGVNGVHHRIGMNLDLKAEAQKELDARYYKGKFYELFGRNYLKEGTENE